MEKEKRSLNETESMFRPGKCEATLMPGRGAETSYAARTLSDTSCEDMLAGKSAHMTPMR